jgi:hypothetical protein
MSSENIDRRAFRRVYTSQIVAPRGSNCNIAKEVLCQLGETDTTSLSTIDLLTRSFKYLQVHIIVV